MHCAVYIKHEAFILRLAIIYTLHMKGESGGGAGGGSLILFPLRSYN
jgi:hypothetical protein